MVYMDHIFIYGIYAIHIYAIHIFAIYIYMYTYGVYGSFGFCDGCTQVPHLFKMKGHKSRSVTP